MSATLFDPRNRATVDLLLPRIREEHGVAWSPACEILFGASALALKMLLPLLPDSSVRCYPRGSRSGVSLVSPEIVMKIDLKQGFLDQLKGEYLRALGPEERAVIEVSTGEMGNKPDAVKLGWLKMRTGEVWTKQRYQRALKNVLDKLAKMVSGA